MPVTSPLPNAPLPPPVHSGPAGRAPFVFRPAVESDLPRLVEIHATAFPDPRGAEVRRRNFVTNPLGGLDRLWVACEPGGAILAHAFLFALESWFGGEPVKVGAVASVGVAPEARGRGLAGALLAHLHEQAEREGAAVMLLYAFRQGFYARHGYAAVTPTRRLSLHPASIPPAWRAEPGITVRAAGERTAIEAAYARSGARTTGWLVRPTALWDRFFADERRYFTFAERPGAESDGAAPAPAIAGYVAWSLEQVESHAATRLVVHELVADDDAARRALLGALGAMRDQVHDVEIEVDARDPLDRALVDADRARHGTERIEHTQGAIAGGPMVRLLDVARAFEARRYAHDGAITVVVRDDAAPLAVRVEVRGGRASVARDAGADVTAALAIDRAALGIVLYGGLAPSDAARLGWAHASAATFARADALFAHAPFHALDPF